MPVFFFGFTCCGFFSFAKKQNKKTSVKTQAQSSWYWKMWKNMLHVLIENGKLAQKRAANKLKEDIDGPKLGAMIPLKLFTS